MALPNYLANIKSSGIYRFVWDKSEAPGVDTQTLRLVVGYSPKGLFNTPVYVETPEQFKTIFGDINKKLERYGIFFHRNALECLKHSPIFCLNLKPFNKDLAHPEEVDYFTFDNTTTFNDPQKTGIKNIFDTNRFWTLEPEKLDSIAGELAQKYITISATDDKNTSKTVIIRGTHQNGYDVTFKDYFAQSLNGTDLPAFLEDHENDIMNDYFAEIYIFNGEWTAEFKTSPNIAKYFVEENGSYKLKPTIPNAFGEEVDTLTVMEDDANTGFVNKYVGILLPDFISPVSTALSLDDVFNADYNTHKLMMHLNSNFLYEGNTNLDEINSKGWYTACKTLSSGAIDETINIYSANNVTLSKEIVTIDDDTLVKTKSNETEAVSGVTSADNDQSVFVFDLGSSSSRNINDFYGEGENVGVVFDWDSTGKVLTETQTLGSGVTVNDGSEKSLLGMFGIAKEDRFMGAETTSVGQIVSLVSIEKGTRASSAAPIVYTYTFNGKVKDITITNLSATPSAIANPLIKCVNGVADNCTSYQDLYLEGYEYKSINFETSQNYNNIESILDVLSDEKGIRIGLTDNVSIEYHYLVDTFTSFLSPNSAETSSPVKNKLAMIAREKDNCLALLNWPSVATLMKVFTNAKTSTDAIANITGNRYYKADAEYQSWVEYVTPLKMKNQYTANKFEVPGAADLSNNYIAKFDSRYPYSIVAGPNYGVIDNPNLVGPDFNYSREELDMYEPYGVNCFVYKPRKGTFINSQQTAKQNPVTTLSKVNVRELVIYLQDEIEKLLSDYQWEFNTQSLREVVKAKADAICEQVKNNGGIYDYFNLCSEENNTDDVINNEMFVLSTSIEPGMGAGKMIQELTIYRKGGMSSIVR